jgi:hypothetical protein
LIGACNDHIDIEASQFSGEVRQPIPGAEAVLNDDIVALQVAELA